MYRLTVTIGTPNVSTICFRLHTSCHDHLTGEHAETPHVRFLMLKHRQVTVHITHLSVFGFNRDPTVNLRHTGWKDWQLHLWHAFSYQPLATYATIFRLILISSTTRKSPASSGGLKLLPPLTAMTSESGWPSSAGLSLLNVPVGKGFASIEFF